MTARDSGWPPSACPRDAFRLVADGRGSKPKLCVAHQAQLLLAGGNPETEAAPVWRRVSV